MRIKFGKHFLNTDHIAHAKFYAAGDQSTNNATPCLVIMLAGGGNLTLYPHRDYPEEVWALLITEATQTVGDTTPATNNPKI